MAVKPLSLESFKEKNLAVIKWTAAAEVYVNATERHLC